MSVRLERFELRAFGPFTDTVLELGAQPAGGFHIICGPNEIGKSTAQRGIGDFLFGIPARSTDNQLHDYPDMRLAGVVIDQDGLRHELVRRKGARSTLLGADSEPVEQTLIAGMLGGMTREVFESMFSITHESLVVGGNALLAAEGDVGESLFSASLGANGLHALRTELDRQANELFRPRASSSLVLVARAALDAVQARLRESTLRATTFTEHERQLKAAGNERQELAQRIRDARTEQNTLRRLRSVIPLLAKRTLLREELEGLTGAPDLPGDAPERRARAVERARRERSAALDAVTRVEDLKERIARLAGDSELLERELAIKDVHGRLANAAEGASDLERQKVKLQSAKDLARLALKQIRPDLQLEEAKRLLLSATERAKVDRCLERHARLSALLEKAQRDCAEAEDRARRLTGQINVLDAPPEVVALEAAVVEAQGEGPLQARLTDAQAQLDDAQTLLDSALSELDPPAKVMALRAIRPPNAATIEEFACQRGELDDRARELRERRERLAGERRDLEEDRAKLDLSANVPSVEDLTEARAERDEYWRRLRGRLEDVKDEGEDGPVPDTFEGQLRHTDDLCDRLRTEADSVARGAQLTIRQRRLDGELEDCQRQLDTLAIELAEHEGRWGKSFSEVRIQPRSPREMAYWLRTRHNVLERADALARRARTLENESDTRDRHLRTLRSELTAAGCKPSAEATLAGLLAMAQIALAQARAQRQAQEDLERELRALEVSAGSLREKAEEHRQALTDWEADWARILTANGWPDDLDGEGARQVLGAVEELARQLHEVDQLSGRVSGIEARLSAFAKDAEQIIREVAPELDSWPAPDAVCELDRRLDKAIQIRSRRQTLNERLEASEEELKSAERALEEAERDLRALAGAAGVQSNEQLPEAERQSARAAALRTQLPELQTQITEAGQAPLEELIARAAGIDVNALDARVAEAEDELARLEKQLADLDVRLGELGSEQQKMEHLDGAASAAELAEQHIAELRALTGRYLHLYIAAWALSEAIDAYRREHKAPLLRRADELFPRLTCGRFVALEVGFDEVDEPMLVGVRANAEKVSVKLMSTGTREQLYLALRLASLERHVELHGPMTVILDDVVLHSDPKRKSAILRALADLGERTQVIAFTHDPHVIALAQNTIDPGRLVVHELGGSEITGSPQLKIDASEVRPIARAIAAWHRHLPTDQQDRAQRSRSSMTVARHSHTLGVQSSVAGALGNSTEGQSTSAAGVQGSVAHTEYSEVIDAAEQMAAPASLSGMFGEVQQESTEPSEGESSV